jgi:ferrous iron transport protein B
MGIAIPAMRTIAVAGQPNTGKSTVFNKITGLRQRVGNWPGKTVDRKEGFCEHKGCVYRFVDLPGTYSLSPYSPEEDIAAAYLASGDADAIIVVVNAASLERSLYLAGEAASLGKPLIIALNMMDVAEDEGITVDAQSLANNLRLPVIPMVATIGKGIASLLDALSDYFVSKALPDCSTSAVQPDNDIFQSAIEDDLEARCVWIERTCREAVRRSPKQRGRTQALDAWLLHPIMGRLIAFLVLPVGCVLGATIGMCTGGLVLMGAMRAIPVIRDALPGMLGGLVANALVPTVGWVCALLSIIAAVHAIFYFLEDTGYLARVAYLLDPALSGFGIDGKAAIPLLMGFLCNTVAITSSRIINTQRQRFIALAMLPFLPCSGQSAVAAIFAFALFPMPTALFVVLGVSAGNLLLVCLAGKTMHAFLPQTATPGLILELPLYHKPNGKTIFAGVRARVLTFFHGAAKNILIALILVWAAGYFPHGTVENSFLHQFGQFLEPVGSLVGFDWRFVVALLSSFAAKEITAGTLAAPFAVDVSDQQNLFTAIRTAISPHGALAFIVASNLFIPCVASISALRVEFGSWKITVALLVSMLAIALTAAYAVFIVTGRFLT